MNWFDLAVLAILAASVGFAIIRGAVRETGTLLILALAGLGAWAALGPMQALTGTATSLLWTAIIAAGLLVVLFIAGYVLMHLALSRFKFAGTARTVDRVAGGVFGLARGLVIVGLGYLALTYISPVEEGGAVAKAATRPLAQGIAEIFEGMAPESTRLDQPSSPPVSETDAAAEGYARADRAALAEIVTTVTTSSRDEPVAAPSSIPASVSEPDRDRIADILKESAPE